MDVPDGRSGNATIPTRSAAAETNPPTTKSVRCTDGGRPGRLPFRRLRRSARRGPASACGGVGAGSGCLAFCWGRRSGWAGPIAGKSVEGDGGSSGCAIFCRNRLIGWPGPPSCPSGTGAGAGGDVSAGAGAGAGTGAGTGTAGGASAGAGAGAGGSARAGASGGGDASVGAGGGGVAGATAGACGGGVATWAAFCRGRRSGWFVKVSGRSGMHCSCAAGPACSASSRPRRRGRPRQSPCVTGRRRRPCALLFLGIGSGMLGSG